MAKIRRKRGKGGYVFYKELGGAAKHSQLSTTAAILLKKNLIRGRVLDYGCGYGYDADVMQWESYDPYYQPKIPTGLFDVIIVNHVINVLTRDSRHKLYSQVDQLLAENGRVFFSVPRNIPVKGKHGPRKRLQNYIVLSLPSIFCDDKEEIYVWSKGDRLNDLTQEFENQF